MGQTDEAETFHENPSNGKTSFPDVNGLPLVCSISGCHIRSLHLRFEVWGQQECMYVHTYMVNSIRHTPCIELLEVPLSIFISGRMCGPKQGEYKGYIFNEWLDTMQQLKYLKVATESLDMKRIGTKNYLNGISALFRGLLENCPCLETVSVDISGAWDVGDQMEKKEFQDSLKVFQQVRPEVEISGLDHQDE